MRAKSEFPKTETRKKAETRNPNVPEHGLDEVPPGDCRGSNQGEAREAAQGTEKATVMKYQEGRAARLLALVSTSARLACRSDRGTIGLAQCEYKPRHRISDPLYAAAGSKGGYGSGGKRAGCRCCLSPEPLSGPMVPA